MYISLAEILLANILFSYIPLKRGFHCHCEVFPLSFCKLSFGLSDVGNNGEKVLIFWGYNWKFSSDKVSSRMLCLVQEVNVPSWGFNHFYIESTFLSRFHEYKRKRNKSLAFPRLVRFVRWKLEPFCLAGSLSSVSIRNNFSHIYFRMKLIRKSFQTSNRRQNAKNVLFNGAFVGKCFRWNKLFYYFFLCDCWWGSLQFFLFLFSEIEVDPVLWWN